ncbi:MAG: hypothetical protein CM15mP83_3820 [Flavobacteriaceae bacterium]|nr:MAG: hypothetical protein CM15mP83_3820 [Flavobacteriaceae bacterium]
MILGQWSWHTCLCCKRWKLQRAIKSTNRKDVFWFELEIPLAVGTVGGLTKLHPYGTMVASITTKSKCKRANANHGSSGLAKILLPCVHWSHWYPERTYENAFTKHTQPNGCYPTRKDAMIKHFTTNVVSFNAVEQALATWRKNDILSSGKLLITCEYAVIDGACALALPTKLGQSMTVVDAEKSRLHWVAKDMDGKIWFENDFDTIDFNPIHQRTMYQNDSNKS